MTSSGVQYNNIQSNNEEREENHLGEENHSDGEVNHYRCKFAKKNSLMDKNNHSIDNKESEEGLTNDSMLMKNVLLGICDICDKKDNFQGHNLQKCRVCGVCVHETCYGLVSTKEKDPNWICKACDAKGKYFTGKYYANIPATVKGKSRLSNEPNPQKQGEDVTVYQTDRPSECVLCSIKGGNHAMHMVYNTHGEHGKPLIIDTEENKNEKRPNKEAKQVAWVHSLCAFFICANSRTSSCVFGCTEDGDYVGIDDEDASDHADEDDASENNNNSYNSAKSPVYDNPSVSSTSDEEEYNDETKASQRQKSKNLYCKNSNNSKSTNTKQEYSELSHQIKKDFNASQNQNNSAKSPVYDNPSVSSTSDEEEYDDEMKASHQHKPKSLNDKNTSNSESTNTKQEDSEPSNVIKMDSNEDQIDNNNRSQPLIGSDLITTSQKSQTTSSHSMTVKQDPNETKNDDDNNEESLDEDEEDNKKCNDDETYTDIHHFVFNRDDEWTTIINDHRRSLKCSICKKRDNMVGALRIAIQCHAGNEEEYSPFKKSHSNSYVPKGGCSYPMHVGCARWSIQKNSNSKNEKQARRVFFYPGKQENKATGIYDDPVTAIYCPCHAMDIKNRNNEAVCATKVTSPSKRKSISDKDYKDVPADWDDKIEKKKKTSKQSSTTSKKGSHKKENKGEISQGHDDKESYSSKSDAITHNTEAKQKNPVNKKYYERKKLKEEVFNESVKEAKKCIQRSQLTNSSIKDSINRLKAHMNNHSGLTKSEFNVVWQKVDEIIRHLIPDDSPKVLTEIHNTNNAHNKLKRRAPTNSMSEDERKKSAKLSSNDEIILLISIDLQKARRRSQKKGISFDHLSDLVKEYWQKKYESKDNFDRIWNEAVKQTGLNSSSLHNKKSNASTFQSTKFQTESNLSQQRTVDPWSFLWFGPNYSSRHVAEFFDEWD